MNVITIEFCAEDRARIDHLIQAMDRLAEAQINKPCETCVSKVLNAFERMKATEPEPDPVQQKLADTLAKANAPQENPTPPPAPAPAPEPEPQREVSLAEFQKALTLRCSVSEDMKAKVRALLNEYAMAASQVPADKRAEILSRLAEL